MKDTLMMAVQITPEERDEFRRIARSKGMMMQGLLAQLVRNTIRDYSSEGITASTPPLITHGNAGDIRDGLSL